MSASNLSVDDLRFRRRGDDECDIVVYGQTVGSVMRRPDIANPNGGQVLRHTPLRRPARFDATRPPRSRSAARSPSMLVERDLVPSTPPPDASRLRGPPAAPLRLIFSLPAASGAVLRHALDGGPLPIIRAVRSETAVRRFASALPHARLRRSLACSPLTETHQPLTTARLSSFGIAIQGDQSAPLGAGAKGLPRCTMVLVERLALRQPSRSTKSPPPVRVLADLIATTPAGPAPRPLPERALSLRRRTHLRGSGASGFRLAGSSPSSLRLVDMRFIGRFRRRFRVCELSCPAQYLPHERFERPRPLPVHPLDIERPLPLEAPTCCALSRGSCYAGSMRSPGNTSREESERCTPMQAGACGSEIGAARPTQCEG